jgi:L-aminopeptidase/D-esterase-like protein
VGDRGPSGDRDPAPADDRNPAPADDRNPAPAARPDGTTALEATTIGIIATNASIDKVGCLRLAQSGHDGLARALDPVHTGGDGDALVAVATGEVEAPLETVRALAAWVVEQAVFDAIPARPPEADNAG